MQPSSTNIVVLVVVISANLLCVTSREMSLIPQRALRDSLAMGSSLKKIFVDIETDVISAISPITMSGVMYPWGILSPALAQNQHNIISADSSRRTLNTNANGQVILSSNLDEVKMNIYQDRSQPESHTTIDISKDPASQGISRIGVGKQVKILIHGFQSGPSLPFALEAKNAYLQETNHSVIVIDWEKLSQPKTGITVLFYPAVTANGIKVGEKVASLIEYLLENKVIADLNQVHIIGHSLGAHAAGYAGDIITSKYGKKIGRITALDAAFLAFLGPNVKRRIDKEDAKFVDAIHTSGIGIYDAVGHVDFYPNGGRNQVSCYKQDTYQGSGRSVNETLSRTFEKIIQSCSHARSYHYFIKTIKKEVFWACKCVSWKDYRKFCRNSCTHREKMGEYTSPAARGKYFLEIDA